MKALRSVMCLVGLLAALPASAAPTLILISDSLLANADPWDVKRGGHFMGINKWQFGEYAVVASKRGRTTARNDTNFFKTKMESSSKNTFSFVLSSSTTDSAFVSAEHQLDSRSNPGLKVAKGTYLGGDAYTVATNHFRASIIIARDTSERWDLFIGSTEISDPSGERDDELSSRTSVLTQGDRRIDLVHVLSKKSSEKQSFLSQLATQARPPAMGFEFVEDGRALCALEYFSSGLSGMYKNRVWMDRNADPRMRLVLAAAMTAVLELRCNDQPMERLKQK